MDTPKLNASQELALKENTPADEFLDFLRNLEIEGEEDLSDANELLHEMDAKAKNLESIRKSITEPINTAKRNVDKLFKPAATALTEAIKYLKAAILTWEDRRYLLPATNVENSLEDASKGLQIRSKWSYTVSHPELLPEEYVLRIPNIAKIQYEWEKHGINLDIPGVEIVETKTLAVLKDKK